MRRSTTWAANALIVAIACSVCIPANATTIAITYSLAGAPSEPPVVTGTTLTFPSAATGSILSDNPSLNASWNPITFKSHDVIDLTAGVNNATFSITFANGSMLSGNMFENVAQVLATNTGPFTQTLTFSGGTGDFAGATGSVSGGGLVETTGFTASGSGTLSIPGIPEPAPTALLLGGLAVIFAAKPRSV